MVREGGVDAAHQVRHLGPHAPLLVQHGAVGTVVDKPLEQRQVEVVRGRQQLVRAVGLELLVVTCGKAARAYTSTRKVKLPLTKNSKKRPTKQ